MGTHKSSFNARVDWMAAHPEVWAGWPTRTQDRFIIQHMREAGLISEKSKDHVIGDLGKLIAAAKNKVRHAKNNKSN